MKECLILDDLVYRYPVLAVCRDQIHSAWQCLVECFRHDGMVFTCGNGGSAADAEHIVGELVKGFCRKRPLSDQDRQLLSADSEGEELAGKLQYGFRAVNLMGQMSIYTAATNDLDADAGIAQQVCGMGRSGDILLGISTSGNARNIHFAAKVARMRKMKIIGLTGQNGGLLARDADVCICVPETETFQVQELHLPVYHALCRMVEDSFFSK